MKNQTDQLVQKRLLDVKTAANYLSISRSLLYQWIDKGRISALKINTRILIDGGPPSASDTVIINGTNMDLIHGLDTSIEAGDHVTLIRFASGG